MSFTTIAGPSTRRAAAVFLQPVHLRLPAPARALSSASLSAASHFDTYLYVKRLQESGLAQEQAEGAVRLLAEVVDESIKRMEMGLVTKEEVERHRFAQKAEFTSLRSELQQMEKNDYTTLKAENDRLLQEVEKLKQRLREEITRTQAGVRLDLNLEKGRIRDEAGQQELRIKEVDTRIESEIAGLRTQIETAKSNIFQFLFGLATGGGALLLAYFRLFR